MNSGVSISATGAETGALNVVFNSNRAGKGGAIVMNRDSSIVTNGGSVSFFGQSTAAPGFAQGRAGQPGGIKLQRATIDTRVGQQDGTAGGSILMQGDGVTAATFSDNDAGVAILGSTLRTGSGNVTLVGRGTGQHGGVEIASDFDAAGITTTSLIQSRDGSISITGTGARLVDSIGNADGVALSGGRIEVLGSGTVRIVGTGGGDDTTGLFVFGGDGVSLSSASIATNSGRIELIGTGGGDGSFTANSIFGGSGVVIDNSRVTSGSGSISITGTGGAGGDGITITPGGEIGDIPSVLSSASGNINLTGTGGSLNTAGKETDLSPRGIAITGSRLSADAGSIALVGTGGNIDSTINRVVAAPTSSDLDFSPAYGVMLEGSGISGRRGGESRLRAARMVWT